MMIPVDGLQIYAATGGRPFDSARPAVIFLHGAGMDHTAFGLQSRWFAWHGWSVLAVDLPGHGRSEGTPMGSVSDLAAWVERLMLVAGIEKAALVGHSMGAAIALEAAARLGPRATYLALLGVAAAMPVHPSLMSAAESEPVRAYRIMTGWSLAHGARIGGNPTPGLWMSGGTLALLAANAQGTLARDFAACSAWTTGKAAAAQVRCPATVVMGALDVMTPPKSALEIAELIPAARRVTLPATGHMMMYEAPDATLDALIAALGRA
jgi:pimeloyl-ACP methyl ester carboxylesterase